jgi:uncharacterized protein (DUF305 family)
MRTKLTVAVFLSTLLAPQLPPWLRKTRRILRRTPKRSRSSRSTWSRTTARCSTSSGAWQSKSVSLPKQPKKEQQSALKKLEGASGSEFDRAYMQQMVEDHEKALKLVQDTAKNAKDAELKQAAEKAAPEVQKHFDMAKQIAGKKSG